MRQTLHSIAIAKAFNDGCEARRFGKEVSDNPYMGSGKKTYTSKAWEDGYWDMHDNYCAALRVRLALPPVNSRRNKFASLERLGLTG